MADKWDRNQYRDRFNDAAKGQNTPPLSKGEAGSANKGHGPVLSPEPGKSQSRPQVVDNSTRPPDEPKSPETSKDDFNKAAETPWEAKQAELEKSQKSKGMSDPSKGQLKDEFNRKSK